LWISSALSIPLDTFIFFGMIDLLTPPVIITALAVEIRRRHCRLADHGLARS
jgi:hypothetical protein